MAVRHTHALFGCQFGLRHDWVATMHVPGGSNISRTNDLAAMRSNDATSTYILYISIG